MRKIILICLTSLLASGIAQATTTTTGSPCNGFEIKVKNNLPHDLMVGRAELQGAQLQPHALQVLKSKTTQVFTVNGSLKDARMAGDLNFYTISLPMKKVNISFELANKTLVCHHHEKAVDSDYSVKKARLPGKVKYKIG